VLLTKREIPYYKTNYFLQVVQEVTIAAQDGTNVEWAKVIVTGTISVQNI
jgi:hypothetical protein